MGMGVSGTAGTAAAGEKKAGVYQEPEAFLAEVFSGDVPAPSLIWVKKDLKKQITRILGHPPPMIRIRYWRKGARSAWILDEIGKEEPITTGFAVNDGRIEKVKVLIFRESRGWEVRYPFFTAQFENATLTPENKLDRNIDGISGATLSVSAVTRLARLALYLDKLTSDGND
ncbi:MAG: FMN-binding protein [Alphaproteobacteria bacterium]|nr:FMN-binding protein [Alphaproteobacteria bacterium]